MGHYLVYTDGSCHYADRCGGYAWKIVDESGNEYLGGGSEVDTTISRMELMAVISALEYIFNEWGKGIALVHSDSEYVVKGFMNSARKRNKNVDLWLWLDEVAGSHRSIILEHVRGHAGHQDNEDVDKLAGEFRQAALNVCSPS